VRKAIGFLAVLTAALTAMAADAGSRHIVIVLGVGGINATPVVDSEVGVICGVAAGLCAAGIVAIVLTRGEGRAGPLAVRVAVGVGLLGILVGYLTWAPQSSRLSLSNIIVAALGGATPLLLGSTAGVISERAGIINITIEGEFLASACAASVVATVTRSPWLGLLVGAAAGALVGGALALLAVRYVVDQIVAGLILITLVTGVTGYLTEQFLDPNQSTLNSPATFSGLGIPGLDRIPVIGKGLFDGTIIFYLGVIAVVATEIVLSRTATGLRVRASGENPAAALGSGVNVRRVRTVVCLVSGFVAGIGGAYFTIGSAGQFIAQMSAGLGYVSLAAVIFGGWRPARAALAALLFGLASSIATSLGLLNVNVNPELLIAAPYVVTIVVLAGAVGGVRPPAADGVPLLEG
jgi:simple sugar transport system permease protein